jgi:hypothetical protein
MTEEIFKWALMAGVGATLSIIAALLVFIFTGFRSDLRDVRTGLAGLTAEVHRKSVELSTAIAAVSGKLDQLGARKHWWTL